MDLQILCIPVNSIQVLKAFIIFTTFVARDLSANTEYEACMPENCGKGPDISYPFWILNRQSPYCGHPNYMIVCNNSYPLINITGNDYLVKDIFYANNSFRLVNNAFVGGDNACPLPMYNVSFDSTPFHRDDDSVFSFFYNCSVNPANLSLYPINCVSNYTHYSFAVMHKEVLERKNYSLESCQKSVDSPLDIDGGINMEKLVRMNYQEVLKMGIVLQWSDDNCSKCNSSGGHCGFENNEFVCFCHNDPKSISCPGSSSKGKKIAIGLGSAAGAALILVALFLFYQRNKKRHYNPSTLLSRGISSYPSSVTDYERGSTYFGAHIFPYVVLEEATNNFDSSKELGDGGFGTVYHGKLRDGRDVAVKKLYENNYKRVEQFMNEVEILSKLRHPNLVTLYGCTSRHSRELILVYEYIPNGTVADHLHGEQARPRSLPWATRLSIAIETASALSYLHHSGIIHRDVKTNNILLDNNFLVKVADFGLSRLFPTDVTHVSTAPQGTPGYLDPEYHECYHLTDKSDVYSFGVVLVELITSMPAVDITRNRHEINLSNMFIKKIQNGQLHELVDPNFGFGSDFKVDKMIMAVAELAFQCLQSEREIRPTMEEVLEALKCIQSGDFDLEKESGVRTPADDVALLKKPLAPFSPDSVTAPWTSRSTTSNDSGSVS